MYFCLYGDDNRLCCTTYREELISHYKQLSDAADLRTAKAQWLVHRRQLHEQRAQLLQSESADGEMTEVFIVDLFGPPCLSLACQTAVSRVFFRISNMGCVNQPMGGPLLSPSSPPQLWGVVPKWGMLGGCKNITGYEMCRCYFLSFLMVPWRTIIAEGIRPVVIEFSKCRNKFPFGGVQVRRVYFAPVFFFDFFIRI